MSALRLVGDVEIWLSMLLALAFVVVYASTARWWEREAGRNVMAFMTVVAAVLALSIIRIFYHASWFAWLRALVFALVPLVIAWRLWMLIRVQVLGRTRRITNGEGNEDVSHP